MSTWIEIEDESQIEISEDGSCLEVLYSCDDSGNNYITIPIDFMLNKIKDKLKE